ncbi:MAG: glycoside hydrolase family 2 TIM barrel-domain containing protein [Verrucomicrobiota bacterium]|nr:glycoside hydrolase family 2 TIM barrel-domain containing protein [Verrucomicrobiota bacterium]
MHLDWFLSHLNSPNLDFSTLTQPPQVSEWRSVSLPCYAQTSSFGAPELNLLLNEEFKKLDWMESCLWIYKSTFTVLEHDDAHDWRIRFHGIDYRARVFLNNDLITDHEGMFSFCDVTIPRELQGQSVTLQVVFLPPKELYKDDTTFTGNASLLHKPVNHLKARYMVGWDFCPALKCVGIWDKVELSLVPSTRIESFIVQTGSYNTEVANVTLIFVFNKLVARGEITLNVDGQTITVPVESSDRIAVSFSLKSPRYWWPNDLGSPNFYSFSVHLKSGTSSHHFESRFGLRTIARSLAPGQKPTDTPAQFIINDRKVWLKGANLTPFSSTPDILDRERYFSVLKPLKDMGVNFLRVWGGGLKEKDCFYDLCDELGFLVMQEFPLACQTISELPEYLRLLDQECRAIVRRIGHHCCLIIWTGGNEHFHFWSAIDSGTPRMNAIKEQIIQLFGLRPDDPTRRGGERMDHPALLLMGKVVAEEDGTRPYNITSAMEGEGEAHGPWTFRLEIGDHRFRDFEFYEFWRNRSDALCSESSISAAATLKTMAKILGMPESQASSLTQAEMTSPLWKTHKAFHAAWDNLKDNWLDIPVCEHFFGELKTLADIIFASHYLQCEGTRFFIEELRRKQGQTTGMAWWGINEPFPSLAGNALIDFFGEQKPACTALKQAFVPVLVSIGYDHLVTDCFRGQVFVTNSLHESKAVDLTVVVVSSTQEKTIMKSLVIPPYTSELVLTLDPCPLGSNESVQAQVTYRVAGELAEHTKCYRLFGKGAPHPLKSLLLLDPAPADLISKM